MEKVTAVMDQPMVDNTAGVLWEENNGRRRQRESQDKLGLGTGSPGTGTRIEQ